MVKHSLLIVDDEPLARDRVRAFVSRRPEITVCGECSDGLEALDRIRSLQPDIVFLDVNMPRCGGLEVLTKLSADARPAIVLASADNRFAVDAFKEQVVDFLLKPFDRERFETALGYAMKYVGDRHAGEATPAAGESPPPPPPRQLGRLAVWSDSRIVVLLSEEIVRLEAANNYSLIHLADKRRLMVRETLSSLEERLGAEDFLRIHRSSIVRVDLVKELQPTKYGDYLVVLRDGTRLPAGRGMRSRLAAFYSGGL
jgi:two-component system LytT family response regulator